MKDSAGQTKPNNYLFLLNNNVYGLNYKQVEEIVSSMSNISMFIRDYDYFDFDISQEEVLKIINKYIKVRQFYDNNIPSNIFENINYLNSYYNIEEKYDYDKYVSTMKNDINLEDLLTILTDEKVFNMFILDYDNNKEYFKKISQNIYNDKIKYLIDNEKSLGIVLDEKAEEKYKVIRNNSADTNECEKLVNKKDPSLNINPKIYEHMIKVVDQSLDKFTIARQIYIELGKIFDYNIAYLSCMFKANNGIFIDNDELKNIFKDNSADFDFENNKVVCHNWAAIYGSLLNIFNIDCTINAGSHSYVEFIYNGLTIEADGTGAYTGLNDNQKIYDLSRIKSGFVTSGFKAKNKSKNIKYLVECADKKIGFNPKEIIDKYEECNDKFMTVECEYKSISHTVVNDLKKIIGICNSYGLRNLEYINLFKAYINSNFSSVERKYININNLINIEENEEKIYIICSIFVDNEYKYYLIGSDRFELISKEYLEDRLSNQYFIKGNSSDTIPGINEEKEMTK